MMEKLDKFLGGISIPVNTSQANTPTYSTENEVCEICHGAGYLRMDVPFGHANFGRTFPCQCKVKEISERNHSGMERLSNMEAFIDKTFETFDPNIQGTRDAFLYARDYARNPTGWILLMGSYGCGKTHLAAAIANKALSSGLQTYFAIVPDLLDTLRSAYAPDSELSYDARFESIRTVPLLVMDDLGTENTTNWAREKLFQIFNHRSIHRLPTVITSNIDLDALEPRIESRICDQVLCKHIFVEAPDYRKADKTRRDNRGNGGNNGNGYNNGNGNGYNNNNSRTPLRRR